MEIRDGFREWIKEPVRYNSPKYDIPIWWKLRPDDPVTVKRFGATNFWVFWQTGMWRLAWIEDTGELFAHEHGVGSDQFIVLAQYDTMTEMLGHMEDWIKDGTNVLTECFGPVELMDPLSMY